MNVSVPLDFMKFNHSKIVNPVNLYVRPVQTQVIVILVLMTQDYLKTVVNVLWDNTLYLTQLLVNNALNNVLNVIATEPVLLVPLDRVLAFNYLNVDVEMDITKITMEIVNYVDQNVLLVVILILV